jgi:hypothetical protein
MPIWYNLSKLLFKSYTLKYLKWDLVPDERDFKVQLAFVKKLKRTLEEKDLKNFYVVIHPQMYRPENTDSFIALLEKEKIPYIHLGHWKMEELTEGPVHLKLDAHYSPNANKVLAQGLAQVLK